MLNIEEMLREVIDPETNYSIIDLKFLRGYSENKEGKVKITLSPPTFFCPPLFLYVILEEVKEKIPNSTINLVNHHDAERLTECINKGLKFHECYSGEASSEYEDVKKRFTFKRKGKGSLTQLSLNVNGEFCKLVAEAKDE